jgi:hypothetical protein
LDPCNSSVYFQTGTEQLSSQERGSHSAAVITAAFYKPEDSLASSQSAMPQAVQAKDGGYSTA